MENETIVTESGRRKMSRARAEQAVVDAENALNALVSQPTPNPLLPRDEQTAAWAERREATLRADVRAAVAYERLREVSVPSSAVWLAAHRATTSMMWELSRVGHAGQDIRRVRDEIRAEMASGTRVTA